MYRKRPRGRLFSVKILSFVLLQVFDLKAIFRLCCANTFPKKLHGRLTNPITAVHRYTRKNYFRTFNIILSFNCKNLICFKFLYISSEIKLVFTVLKCVFLFIGIFFFFYKFIKSVIFSQARIFNFSN